MKFIHAIAILNAKTFQRVQYAQEDQTVLGMFPARNQFANMEKLTLPRIRERYSLDDEGYDRPSHVLVGKEHHYLIKAKLSGKKKPGTEDRDELDAVIAIVSKQKLANNELTNLAHNLGLIYAGRLEKSLTDVINDPILFTNSRNLNLKQVQGKLGEVKVVMLEAIDKAIGNKEELDKLLDKSEKLLEGAVDFKKSAKRVNSCCRY